MDSRRVGSALCLATFLVAGGCLKTLDESLLDAKDGGAAGSSGAGGAGGSGGSSGGSGGGSSGGAPSDAGSDASVVPYDPTKFPVTTLAEDTDPDVITADSTHVYAAKLGTSATPLVRFALSGGAGSDVPGVALSSPLAIATLSGSLSVFSVGAAAGGALVERAAKVGGPVSPITVKDTAETPTALFASSDGFAYMTASASAGTVSVLRFSLAAGATTTESLLVAAAAESGGPVVATPTCVYWVSNGNVWVMPTAGGARVSALSANVADAVSVTADAVNLYYARSSGSVWKKPLDSTCVAAANIETQLASGFPQVIGGVTAYEGKIAWTVRGNENANYADGGVFSVAASGGTVTQIGPETGGPRHVLATGSFVVFTTWSGGLYKVPKNPT